MTPWTDIELARCAKRIGLFVRRGLTPDAAERIAALIAACGLSLHPATHHLYDESYISALKTLASVGLGRHSVNRGDE